MYNRKPLIHHKRDRKNFSRIRNLEIKYAISISISILIVLISIGYILKLNFAIETNPYIAEYGVLDLGAWEGYDKDNIELIGEWEFYPGELIDISEGLVKFPNEIKDTNKYDEYKSTIKYVQVPGPWNSYLNESHSSNGSGTYRLVIRVPNDGIYGIKTGTIRAACRIFLNGDEVANMGRPSLTKSDFIPSSKYNIGYTKSIDRKIELVIQVSNYNYRKGGILKPIKFGSVDSISNHINKERAVEALMIATLFLISIIFLIAYFQRGREPYIGYFGMGNAFMAIYLSTMNNQLLALLVHYGLIGRIRVQIVAMVGVTVCFLRFVYHFFRAHSNKKIMNGLTVMMLFMLIFAINNPLKTPSVRIGFVQIVLSISILVSYGYIFSVLIKAINRKIVSLEYIIVVATSVFSYWLVMSMKILFEMDLGYLPIFSISIIMIGTTLLITNRLKLEYNEATELTEERLENEFKYFYSQISPHFLYNTINTIIALSYKNVEKTRDALNYLSVYFRGKLELHIQKGLIPIDRELDMVMAYLEIEKMRYGDKLKVEYDIGEEIMAMDTTINSTAFSRERSSTWNKAKKGRRDNQNHSEENE